MLMQVEDAAALKSTAERQGKNVEVLPDERLFFIDKVLEALCLASLAAAETVSCARSSWDPIYLFSLHLCSRRDLYKARFSDHVRPYWLQVQAGPEKVKTSKQTAKEKVLRSKAIGDASRVQPVVWYGSM